jgi:GNAT superfamily N-acetyltransferase
MNITFDNIDTIGHVINENDLYKHYHYPEMLTRYSSNFIEFKEMLSVDKFIEAERFLRSFHLEKGQHHVQFIFPQDQKIPKELSTYLETEGYDTGSNELYVINPSNFPEVPANPYIRVEMVSMESLEDYLELQYEQDLQFGESFAEEKQELLQQNFKSESVVQIIAYYKGIPSGSVDIILKENTAEIDNLFVKNSLQRKGIGSRLQKFVMESYRDRMVILVADGEDTPREMYQKQNYQYLGFQYEALKVYND